MTRSLLDIRIGTMVRGGIERPADYVRQILPHGFESIQLFFWQTLGRANLERLAAEIRDAIGDADVAVSLAMFGNPLEDGDLDRQSLAGWEALIDNARLFGAEHSRRLHRASARPTDRGQSAALPRSLDAARQARRGQRRAHRLRKLRDERQLEERRLEHRPQSRRLGNDVQRSSLRQSRAGMGALPPARLSDRSDPPDPQMGREDLSRPRQGRDGAMGCHSRARRVRQAPLRPDAHPRLRRQRLELASSANSGSRVSRARSTSRAGTTLSTAKSSR